MKKANEGLAAQSFQWSTLLLKFQRPEEDIGTASHLTGLY